MNEKPNVHVKVKKFGFSFLRLEKISITAKDSKTNNLYGLKFLIFKIFFSCV